MRLARVVESFFPPLLAWGVGEGLGALVVGWEVYSSVKIEVGCMHSPVQLGEDRRSLRTVFPTGQ
jgi:hypothetical protein